MADDPLCGVIEGFYGRPWTTAQRLELFAWMEAWAMDTYVYGPKDDPHVRAAWRHPYDRERLDELRGLIEGGRARGVAFVYTLAPGLDLAYADPDDLRALEARVDQLLDVGLEHLCLVFDDIPFRLAEADEARFGTFAGAQAWVANALLDHVRRRSRGLFLFCPTDYCGRMARPSVAGSAYLRELGEALHPDVEVFWTGPEVVSETIDVASIREVREVLRRKPLVWDNLHANDYDLRRAFLGPYRGRPRALRGEVRGVLTNPNNEHVLNPVGLHTLALWAREEGYEPRAAYRRALSAWLPRFARDPAVGGEDDPVTADELELLGDLFHLPFEHGERAEALLTLLREMIASPPEAWGDRLERYRGEARAVARLFEKLTELEDRELFYALHGYVAEARHELLHIAGYLRWLHDGRPGGRFGPPDRFSATFRGGLTAELARLVPSDASGALGRRTERDGAPPDSSRT